jgi:hypothetical protein
MTIVPHYRAGDWSILNTLHRRFEGTVSGSLEAKWVNLTAPKSTLLNAADKQSKSERFWPDVSVLGW